MLRYHYRKSFLLITIFLNVPGVPFSFFVLANNRVRCQEMWSSAVENVMGQERDFDIEFDKIRRDVVFLLKNIKQYVNYEL